MKHKLLLFMLLLCSILKTSAQTHLVRGTVVSQRDESPMELATVRLLSPDSTLVTGTFTDSLGNYILQTDRRGPFIVHASYIGFEPAAQNIRIGMNKDTVNVEPIRLKGNEIALRSAEVRATVEKMEQVEDTTVFNATAYRTPEGATLEALIKLFPGMEVSEDGKITWNGKEIKEFLINGKDFFKGDTEVAMKNLPVRMVKKIKAYDKKSDYAEQTGIDDGEESTVLDIMTKRELNQSLVSNIDIAGGWDWDDHALYSGKLFVTRFSDKSRVTAFASRNNIGDTGFGGRGGFGGSNGITTSTMAGFDFNWTNGKKRFSPSYFEINGNVRYNGRDNETESTSSSQTFMSGTTAQSFQNAHSWRNSVTHNLNTSFRLQWSPDSLTSLSFRPSYTFSRSNSDSQSQSLTFDQDPFENIPGAEDTDDILNHFFGQNNSQENVPEWLVNMNRSTSESESQSHSVSATLNITRRLTGKQGRNINLNANGSWSNTENFSYSQASIFTRQRSEGETSGTQLKDNSTHQFSTTPSTNWRVNVGASYVEPLGGKWYGELRYNFEHRLQDSDRSLYTLYNSAEALGKIIAEHPEYSSIGLYQAGQDHIASWVDPLQAMNTIDEGEMLAAIRDASNSQYAQYTYNNQSARVGVRLNTENIRFNAAVNLSPEHTVLDYQRNDLDTTAVRNVFNVSPEARLRINFSKTKRLNLVYRGSSSQPSMTNLLPVVDTSNPLNISAGNTGLEPSWQDNLRINYNGYDPDKQAGTMVSANFKNERRSISTLQIYDETSGVRYSRPENINGNWSTSAGLTYNRALGKEKLFNISTSTNLNYSRQVGYSASNNSIEGFSMPENPTYDNVNLLFNRFMQEGAGKTHAKTTDIGEKLDISYRRTLWDVTLNGTMNYQHSISDAMNARNLDTWSFRYGGTFNLNLDCGLSFSTDIGMRSRRGYSEASMNTNELIWNAQLSQSFLKGKALTVSLQCFDILQQQSNISRNISAMMREDTWNNSINSYFMVHLIYKLNLFNGSRKGGGNDEGPRNPEGFGGGRPPMGGPGGGGPGGGGRPPMGGPGRF